MPGRPMKYPWPEWFEQLDVDGAYLRIPAAQFLGLSAEEMRRRILARARVEDVALRTQIQLGGRFIRVERISGRQQYPWALWLGGQMQELRPGVDFALDVEIMRACARRAAKRRGLGFRSRLHNGSLWVQALPIDTNTLESPPVG